MIQRIDLFLPPHNKNPILHAFTQQLAAALTRQGVSCRLLESQFHNPQPFLEKLFEDRPDCTLSFNGLLPDDQGRFFCDLVEIPHVACLVDSPNGFLPLIHSRRTFICCSDQSAVDFFKGVGATQLLFLPHATGGQNRGDPESDRPCDLLFLGSYIDAEQLRNNWSERYPEVVEELLIQAADLLLRSEMSMVEALAQVMDKLVAEGQPLDMAVLHYPQLLEELEGYLCGKERLALIKAFHKCKITLYTPEEDLPLWRKALGEAPNVEYQVADPFADAMSLLQQAKIVLNSSPHIRRGGHERIYNAMEAGALVVTGYNPYLGTQFHDGKELLFYRYQELDQLEARVEQLLKEPSKRCAIAQAGQKLVLERDTWDQRAVVLLAQLHHWLKQEAD